MTLDIKARFLDFYLNSLLWHQPSAQCCTSVFPSLKRMPPLEWYSGHNNQVFLTMERRSKTKKEYSSTHAKWTVTQQSNPVWKLTLRIAQKPIILIQIHPQRGFSHFHSHTTSAERLYMGLTFGLSSANSSDSTSIRRTTVQRDGINCLLNC